MPLLMNVVVYSTSCHGDFWHLPLSVPCTYRSNPDLQLHAMDEGALGTLIGLLRETAAKDRLQGVLLHRPLRHHWLLLLP